MKLTGRLVFRPIASVLTASLLVAALGGACLDGQVETRQENSAGATAVQSNAALEHQDAGSPGISDAQVLFGQSAAFTGPAQELGQQMRLGIEAAFHEANQAGGVHGRHLKLESLDDAYEDDFAYTNTERLIENNQVFALIGAVGTPTSRAASPLAHAAGVPFLAPFTGAEFLRDPHLDNVLNFRASYYQETEAMVARLTEDLGVTRVAVLYQNDSYGLNGLEGTRLALERRGLEPVASWHYERNTSAVKGAALRITEANPEAVIMIGSYAPVVRTIELVRRELDPVFMAVFVCRQQRPGGRLGGGRRWRIRYASGSVAAGRQQPSGRALPQSAVRVRVPCGARVRFVGGLPCRASGRGRSRSLRSRTQPGMLPPVVAR